MSSKLPLEWDLEKFFYKGFDDPQIDKDIKSFQEDYEKFKGEWEDREHDFKKPKLVAKVLEEYSKLLNKHGYGYRFSRYADFTLTLDSENSAAKSLSQRASEVAAKTFSHGTSFIVKYLGNLDEDSQKVLLESEKLSEYEHLLETVFRSGKYVLSSKVEDVISMLRPNANYNWWEMISEIISNTQKEYINPKTGEKELKTLPELNNLITSKDIKARKAASNLIYEIFDEIEKVAESEINNFLNYNKKIRDIRDYPSILAPRLIQDDIDEEFLDALFESFDENVTLSHRYYDLVSRILDEKEFDYNDRQVTLTSPDKEYSYEESIEMLMKVLEDKDPIGYKVVKEMTENAQVDVMPKKGKRGGAFCAGMSHRKKSFILLNHTNQLKNVLTIAHEFGHAIHNHLIWDEQQILNSDTSLATAEVASTFYEALMSEYLLEQMDKEEKFYFEMYNLQSNVASIFRQLAAFKFEKSIHEAHLKEGYLDSKLLGTIFNQCMKNYLGPKFQMTEQSGLGWTYWSHFRAGFYVYSYASGKLISNAMYERVKQDPAELKTMHKALAYGSSKSPADAFENVGIDIKDKSFWDLGFSNIEKALDRAEKIGKELDLL